MPVLFPNEKSSRFIQSLPYSSLKNFKVNDKIQVVNDKIQVQGALNENLPLISSIILGLPQQVLFLGLEKIISKYFCENENENLKQEMAMIELVQNFPLLVKTFIIQYLATLKLPIEEVLALFS